MDYQLWQILEHQGRTLRWLARRTGYSEDLLTAIRTGRRNATAEFRARCVDKLDLPEDVLFAIREPIAA
jgi:hypothetical protein